MKKRTGRKWALSTVLMVGTALWMREVGSWRPKTVAKLGTFFAHSIQVSRDGRQFLVTDRMGQGLIVDTEQGVLISKRPEDFDKRETFPRVSTDVRNSRFVFSAARGKGVGLKTLAVGLNSPKGVHITHVIGQESIMQRRYGETSRFGWSKSRREVYAELNGEIFIWRAEDGKLKRRVHYARFGDSNALFSPDGKWLLADQNGFLRCYNVQNGKMVKTIQQLPAFRSVEFLSALRDMGFSPDGKLFWYVQRFSSAQDNLKVLRVADWKLQWSASSTGAVKWLPDGRLGIVQKSGFEWRLPSGREIRQLPGPFGEIADWVLSPDGDWIYALDEQNGAIRKWRAR